LGPARLELSENANYLHPFGHRPDDEPSRRPGAVTVELRSSQCEYWRSGAAGIHEQFMANLPLMQRSSSGRRGRRLAAATRTPTTTATPPLAPTPTPGKSKHKGRDGGGQGGGNGGD
jgi:hypothetical protein